MKALHATLTDREKRLLNRLKMSIAIKDELHSGFEDVRLWDHEWETLLDGVYGKLAAKGTKDREELSALKDKLNGVLGGSV